jgi:hypothetical protein
MDEYLEDIGDGWKVEHLFARLQNFRHLVTRREYHLFHLIGIIQLRCIIVFLKLFKMGRSIGM